MSEDQHDFKLKIFDINAEDYTVYLRTKQDLDSLYSLIDTCTYLINYPEKVCGAPAPLERYTAKLAGWLVFIGKLAADSNADKTIKFAERFRHFKHMTHDERVKKPEFKNMTDGACKQYTNSEIKREIRNAEIFGNLYESIKELVQSLRAIIRARETNKYGG